MTLALGIAIVLSVTAGTAFLLRPWRHSEAPRVGLMSQHWISEQRADESRHLTT
jgi:hypothetical protein